MPRSTKCTDHLENHFNSIRDMCKYYDIHEETFKYRYRIMGWNLKDSLTIRSNPVVKRIESIDHLGNTFRSINTMCKYYGISIQTFKRRMSNGKMSLEKALTSPLIKFDQCRSIKCKDHLGNEFLSISKMCEHYKISKAAYHHRKNAGWSLEDCLTKEIKK